VKIVYESFWVIDLLAVQQPLEDDTVLFFFFTFLLYATVATVESQSYEGDQWLS